MGCKAYRGEDGRPMFICGDDDLLHEPCYRCGFDHQLLCDWPIGEGKTCDIQMCPDHTDQVGDDLHLCQIHKAMFDEQELKMPKTPNVWPPQEITEKRKKHKGLFGR